MAAPGSPCPSSGVAPPPGRGGIAYPDRIEDSDEPPGRHVEFQPTTAEDHRALAVARTVRAAVTAAAEADAPDPATVAVLVTAVEPARGRPA